MPPKVSAAGHTEEPVSAVAREELVAELLPQRDLAREHVGGQQPLGEVVVAPVAVASCETENAIDGSTPRAPRGRCSSVRRTSRSSLHARSRSRAMTKGPRRGCARGRARLRRRSRRECGTRSCSTRETTEARRWRRARVPCCTPRRSRGAHRAGRTTRGRSRPRARAARGHGFDRQQRADRTGSSPGGGRPRARRLVLPRANAPARARGEPRGSDVRPRQ